jgi:hypothetical protein
MIELLLKMENPAAGKEAGKRGKGKQSKAWLLLGRLLGYKEEYLRFSRNFRAPFGNSQAGRASEGQTPACGKA